MSYYEDERRRYRPAKDRPRHDSYDDDAAYNSRDHQRGGGGGGALVKRRDSYDSVEEVSRDFSPGRGGYIRETTIRKSGTRPARARSYDDDRYDYDDRQRGSGGRHHGRYDDDKYDRRSRRYSSDYSSRSRSRTPPRRKDKEHRKSKTEEALASLGLGGLAATLLGKKEHSRERDRERDRSRDRDRGKSRGRDRDHSEDRHGSRARSKSRGPSREQITQALKAAVLAGAGEAVRARKEPGGWTGGKGKRVMTAAISAGGLDTLLSHGKGEEEHKTRNTIGSAIAGMATSRLVNGPRDKSRPGSPDSRHGRSQSRGGLGDVAAGGVVAAAAKKAYDAVRSRSESRGRPRSRSVSSYDSRSPSRNRSHTSRRRSVSRGVAKGLAAVGLTGAADKVDPERRRADRRVDEYDNRSGGYGYDDRDYYRDDVGPPQPGFPNRAASVSGAPRSLSRSHSDWDGAHHDHTPSRALDYGAHHYGDPDTDSDSDLGSSSGEEKERKRGKRKTLVTSGLAAVATIHAGHSVYQSYNKRHMRQIAVREGKITAEQAKANRNRDRLQDAASIGLAALGIKGAYSEMKEMKEARKEFLEKKETIERHRQKRAARREKFHNGGYSALSGDFSHSMPDLHAPQPLHAVPYRPAGGPGYPAGAGQPFYGGHGPYDTSTISLGPHYSDDNPYSSHSTPAPMPGPPMPAPTPMTQNFSTHIPASFSGMPRTGQNGHTGYPATGPISGSTPGPRVPGPTQTTPFAPGAPPAMAPPVNMSANAAHLPPGNGGPPPPVQPH